MATATGRGPDGRSALTRRITEGRDVLAAAGAEVAPPVLAVGVFRVTPRLLDALRGRRKEAATAPKPKAAPAPKVAPAPPPPPPPVRVAPVVVLPRLPRLPLIVGLGSDLDTVIADRFNLSPSRVQQIREAAGIPAFVAVRREAIRAVAGSKSDAALAAELGVDRKTIRKHRRDAGIENDYNAAVANRDATIRALIDANPGASLRAIAAEAGVNASTVMRVRRTMEAGG